MPKRSLAVSNVLNRRGWVFGAAFALVVGCSPATEPEPLTVFAAASLTDALGQVATAYERASGEPVRLSFAGSGEVVRQVQAGAPADLVVLADEIWMDRLEQAGDVVAGSRVDLLGNRLVVIAADDARIVVDPFLWLIGTEAGRLAIGDPESVPAGRYARAWLKNRGVWDVVRPRIVTAADVRAARTFVERGEAALGVVYRSDMVGARRIRVVIEPPAAEQPEIVYPAAVVRSGSTRATAFMTYLRGPEAARIFAANGFDPAP